jgi:nicotinate-nucleotide adenylyltransferase
MRLGLLFGSFNPIHNGHLRIADRCIEQNLVDCIDFVVAYQNPYKSKYSVSFFDRALMVEDAIRYDNNHYMINCMEEHMKTFGFDGVRTYDVLKRIKTLPHYSDVEIVIICGDDVYNSIITWYRGDEILKENKFIVFTRNEDIPNKINDNIISYLTVNDIADISSSKIREMIKNGEDISEYVPKEVYEQIKFCKFYTK